MKKTLELLKIEQLQQMRCKLALAAQHSHPLQDRAPAGPPHINSPLARPLPVLEPPGPPVRVYIRISTNIVGKFRFCKMTFF